ncbi:MAG: acyltransferase family protein [Pseudomonadota bacterium]
MTSRHAPSYRPDIDGLRAIAVLSVVLYHFGVPGLGGGFVGVDIFFVISGFLIGGLLWREAEDTGRIRLARFFARRIKRLAPAFATMALAVAAASYVILLPFEFREFGKSLIAATVYLSNVHFYREAGYFDTGAEDKILLHTWSLAVEEQFYIILPLVILLLAKRLGMLRAFLWVCFALSFAASLWILPRSQPAAFYLFPFRAWELLAGVLLAIEAQRHQFTFCAPPALGWLGLALTLAGIIIIPSGTGFPGLWALLPVAGAVVLIASGLSNSPVTRLLRHPIPVGIGLISYSLYLWHWPVVTLYGYWFGKMSALASALLIVLSFALAFLSWLLVERPVRRATLSLPAVFGGGILASALLVGIGGFIFIKNGMIDRFGDAHRTHIEATADFLQDWSRCTVPSDGPFAGIETCPIGPEGAPRILVWGDSHVRALKEGLEQLAFETDTPALLIWRAGCAPVFGLSKSETAATPAQNAACTEANNQIETALTQGAFAKVLLVGRWGYYAGGGGTGIDTQNKINLSVSGTTGSQAEQFATGLMRTIKRLQSSGSSVAVLRSIPEIAGYDARQISRVLNNGARADWNDAPGLMQISQQEVEARDAPLAGLWGALASTGTLLLDPAPFLCSGGTCSAVHDGVGQYFDNNHLTNSAARRIRSLFEPFWTSP